MDEIPDFPQFTSSQKSLMESDENVMKDCMVQVDMLTTSELNMWVQGSIMSSNNRYHLRERPKSIPSVRFSHLAKQDVAYTFTLGSSQDEDTDDPSVKLGRWNKKHTCNIYVPIGGPSNARIAVQQRIQQ